MALKRFGNWLKAWILRGHRSDHTARQVERGPQSHVIILDGTMSSLETGRETNAGLTYKLLREVGHVSVFYEAGVQWTDWRSTPDVLMGRGINRQIRRAYGFLASRYRPGDRIFLIGYSRGAFAVRSLAGAIDRVGLLQATHANVRNIRQLYRHYERSPDGDAAKTFARAFCHETVDIEMVGVWDTVKALGLRLPLLWRLTEERHKFHNHQLGERIRHGFHALALDETREVYEPVLWQCPDDYSGRAEQVWFRGSHGDIGGQLNGFEAARPLANIPLVWMLEKAETCDLPLPDGWRQRFATDVNAQSVGTWQSWGKIFLFRKKRTPLLDRSESVHPTAVDHAREKGVLGDARGGAQAPNVM